MQQNESASEYYISREQIIDIRMLAAGHSRGMFSKYALGILLIFVFVDIVPSVVGMVFPRSYFDLVSLPAGTAEMVPALPYSTLLYNLFMSGVFLLGRSLYCLYFLRNRKLDYNLPLEGFGNYLRASLLYLIQTLLISAGTMAFIAPGVVLFYCYRQAFYLLAENPDMGPIRCLQESRRMMRGNKMHLFRLDLSYFFLLVAAYIPQYVVAYFMPADTGAAATLILYVLLSIPAYLVTANMYLGQTVFYELLHSHGFRNFRYTGEEIFRQHAE